MMTEAMYQMRVPMEPTEEMMNAGIRSLGSDDDRPTAFVVLDLWCAMLLAFAESNLLGNRPEGLYHYCAATSGD
jgi:hypothetical protein